MKITNEMKTIIELHTYEIKDLYERRYTQKMIGEKIGIGEKQMQKVISAMIEAGTITKRKSIREGSRGKKTYYGNPLKETEDSKVRRILKMYNKHKWTINEIAGELKKSVKDIKTIIGGC